MRTVLIAFLALSFTALPGSADTADVLDDLIGYTIVASTQVSGTFNGADHGRLVKLDNGLVFEFKEYSYTYSYRPKAVVLAERWDAEKIRAIDPKSPLTSVTFYKLVIGDKIYDVNRVR